MTAVDDARSAMLILVYAMLCSIRTRPRNCAEVQEVLLQQAATNEKLQKVRSIDR